MSSRSSRWLLALRLSLWRPARAQSSIELELGAFFNLVLNASQRLRVLEVGSRIVRGQEAGGRRLASPSWEFTGADIVPGSGVDVVLKDPHRLPFADGSFDVAVSTDTFEHADFFWLTFLEMCRVAKTWIYVRAPSAGPYHAFPQDNWRFQRDAPQTLAKWAQHNGLEVSLAMSLNIQDSWQWEQRVWKPTIALFSRSAHPDALPSAADKVAALARLLSGPFSPEYVLKHSPHCWGPPRIARRHREKALRMITMCCSTGLVDECFRWGLDWGYTECCVASPKTRVKPTYNTRSVFQFYMDNL